MSRPLALTAACLLVAAAAAAPVPKKEDGPAFLDLKPHANQKLKDSFNGGRYADNNLASLPTGKQTFAGVKFHVGDGLIQLGSNRVKGPAKVEGIKVGRQLAKLHFLHATLFNADAGTVIAKYVVRYDDKTTAEVKVAYGKDVIDWWAYTDEVAPTVGKTAWEGENKASKMFDAKIRLYRMTWENPHPKKRVKSIDFVATAMETMAAPFCVAITADDK